MNLCILFDMDGTLVNSFEGIFHSYEYTFQKLKLPFGGESFVRKAIGLTLPFVFEKLCGMHEKQIPQAIQYYREFYANQGQYECTVYPGMKETLERLRKSGNFLGVATLKKESFAREILRRQGLASLFDCICGMDEKDTRTKTDLIHLCRETARASKEKTILIGDTISDAIGAQNAGVSFLAVTYGFGFQRKEELEQYPVRWIATYPQQIAKLLSDVSFFSR